MNPLAPYLERLRIPDPALQRFAVAAIFEKLKSFPSSSQSGLDSAAGKDVLYQCLNSDSVPVVEQTVHEICFLVKEARMKPQFGFQELLAALEGCGICLVPLYVKGIGFICGYSLENDPTWMFQSSERHPFVMVISSRVEARSEALQQMTLIFTNYGNKDLRTCSLFLKPFIFYVILQIRESGTSSYARDIILSLSSLSCFIFPRGIHVLNILVDCLKHTTCASSEDVSFFITFADSVVDAFLIIVQKIEGDNLYTTEVASLRINLLEALMLFGTHCCKLEGGIQKLIEVIRRLLFTYGKIQQHVLELSSVVNFLFYSLHVTDLEHEQLKILKLATLVLEMKNQCEPLGVYGTYEHVSGESGHIFFILPVLHLILSTSRSTKAASLHLASLCEKILNHSLMGQRLDIIHIVPSVVTRPDVLVQKLIHQLRMQEKPLPNSIYCLNLVSKEAPLFGCNRSPPIEWLRQVCQCFLVNKQQTTWQFKGMFVLVGAIFSALLADQSLVSSTIDLLAVIGTIVPELGLSLFLVVLFYTRNFCSNKWHSPEMLVKLLGILPALAAHSFLIEPILQTLFLMLREDGCYMHMLFDYFVKHGKFLIVLLFTYKALFMPKPSKSLR